MASLVKHVTLKRSEDYGYGFSVLGGAGSKLPPIVYDIIDGSPASKSCQLSKGDIICEVNEKEVLSCTTKEVLNYLRLSPGEVYLKLKTDTELQEKIQQLIKSPNSADALRTAITQEDLIGVRHILAQKSETQSNSTGGKISKLDSHQSSSSKNSRSSSDYDESSRSSDDSDLLKLSEGFCTSGDLMLEFAGASLNSSNVPSPKSLNYIKGPTSCSLPSSPNDKEFNRGACRQALGSPQSLCSPLPAVHNLHCGPFIYPPSSASVRISKSEDYLQHPKDNMSSINIELDEDINSSLNTLLETKDDMPICSSFTSLNSCVISNQINSDDNNATTVWSANKLLTSSSESCEHSSHDSDSPLIHSLSPVSPQSPTSSMQFSCSGGIYDKIYSARDSVCSSNRSDNVCSNSSSLTSPDTDVPDELEWDDTTPTFSPTNQLTNGFHEKTKVPNGHSFNMSGSPPDSSVSDKISRKLDENRIVIRVSGPGKLKLKKQYSLNPQDSGSCNGDPDKTPTNTPPPTPGSGTLSPETLAYQQLWESEEEITCLSEKSDESSCSAMTKPQRVTCATSPPHSEDESDIESLHSFHFCPKAVDMPSVVRLAKRLYALDGFKKTDVSRHLSKNNEFSKSVAEEYLRYFSFKGDTLDAALRKFLDKFCLTGETQERERVLVHFSKRYLDCNPGTFNSQDAVHTLTCALMLLNTDLHSQNVGRKMTSAEFTDNLAELNDGENFSSNVLKFLYEAVKKNPLKWAADEELADIASGQKGKEDGPMIIGSNPFLTAPMGSGIIYKKGYIMRKCCVEPNGKRTAFGKRSWKMWFCVIQDLVLYLHKDEQGARKGPLPQVEQNAVRLHHALAIRAHDYAKKEHVFRLQTADQAEYLLQTSDSKELQAWIDAINFVASSLSAAPMAGAVGSQHKFQRPLLPCSLSKLNIVDQLEDHVKRVAQLEKDLEEHRDRPPDKISCKSTTISCYKEKEVYLACEIKRYQTYVSLLKSRLEGASGALSGALDMVSDLPVFETNKAAATAGGDDSTAATDSSGEVKREDVPWVVPPPIPDRPRTTDSSDDASVEKQTQTTLKKDDFKKELEKLLKENEKREKKAQKKEESQNTLTRKKKNKDAINSPEETKPVDETEIQTQINDKKTKSTEKECEEKMKPQEESLKSPEAQLGTMDKLKAVFKFSKLNRENTKAVTNKEEIIQMETVAQTETRTLPLTDDDDDVPPPLPPKPAAATAARMNLYMGTRIDI